MCLLVVINVRDGYSFPYSENIPPNNATTAIWDVFYKDLTVCAIGQMKANRSTCHSAGAIFRFNLSQPCEWKTLVMAVKSQKPQR